MDKFLGRFNLPRVNLKETENMNRSITSTEIETVIKKSSSKQKSRTRWLHRQILSDIWRSVNIYPSQTIAENHTGRDTPKFILRDHHHPDIKSRQRYHKKENCRPVSLVNMGAELKKLLVADYIQQYIKRIIHHYQVGFIPGMQGLFSIHNLIM